MTRAEGWNPRIATDSASATSSTAHESMPMPVPHLSPKPVHIVASYDEIADSYCSPCNVQGTHACPDDEVVGVVLKNKRRIKTIIKRQSSSSITRPRKKRGLTLRLSRESRLAKWEAFENADLDHYVLHAATKGFEVCLVTLKLPLRDWLPHAPTPKQLKEGLNRWMRKVGTKGRFGLAGFDKPIYCLSVLEFKIEAEKAPHFHLVMMLPPNADHMVRELWATQLDLPQTPDPDDVAHISRKYYDPTDPVESFRRAARYLCRDKGLQEVVAPLWIESRLEVGNMWAVRGFEPYADFEHDLRKKEVASTKGILESVSTRPRYYADKATGELKRNFMPRHQPDSPNGNTEVLGDRTDEIFARIREENGWR